MEWPIAGEYCDVLSGLKDTRPDYQRLLTACRELRANGSNTVVVVAALDRFGRRLLERVRSREELKALGVPTHSCREGGEVSDLVANILAAVAQEEVARLAMRVQASKRYITSLGWKPPGRAPYGYIWRDASDGERAMGAPRVVLDLDERSAPSVRDAFQRVADGASIRSVTAWLRSLPPDARADRSLPYPVVSYMLRAPVYLARPDQGDADIISRPVQRWPAIVEDATWIRVRARIQSHETHHHQASGNYLLTGYFRCPLCGHQIVGNTDRRRDVVRYRCSSLSHGDGDCMWSIRVGTLDRPVLRELARLLASAAHLDPSTVSDAWDRLANPGEIVGYRQKRLAALRVEMAAAKDRLLKATRMYVDGQIEQGGYELIRDDAQVSIAGGEAEIVRLTVDDARPVLPTLETALEAIGSWDDLLESPELSVRLKREVLAQLVASVNVERVPPAEGRTKGKYVTRVRWTQLGDALRAVSREQRRSLQMIPL